MAVRPRPSQSQSIDSSGMEYAVNSTTISQNTPPDSPRSDGLSSGRCRQRKCQKIARRLLPPPSFRCREQCRGNDFLRPYLLRWRGPLLLLVRGLDHSRSSNEDRDVSWSTEGSGTGLQDWDHVETVRGSCAALQHNARVICPKFEHGPLLVGPHYAPRTGRKTAG